MFFKSLWQPLRKGNLRHKDLKRAGSHLPVILHRGRAAIASLLTINCCITKEYPTKESTLK